MQHKENKFEMKQLLGLMSVQAQTVGIRNLAALFKAYVETVSGTVTPGFNRTDFTGQALELDCGGWTATDTGIYGTDKVGFEVVACYHPIMPVPEISQYRYRNPQSQTGVQPWKTVEYHHRGS